MLNINCGVGSVEPQSGVTLSVSSPSGFCCTLPYDELNANAGRAKVAVISNQGQRYDFCP